MDSFNSKFNLLSVKTGNDYDKFKEGCRKFGHMVYRGRDHLQLGQLLDELNSLDYTFKFLDEEIVSNVLQHCCHLVPLENEQLVTQYCWLIMNTLNRQQLILIHHTDLVTEYLIQSLNQCKSATASILLRALATVIFENAGRLSQFHSALIEIIVKHMNDKSEAVRWAAVQCIENLTFRVAGDSVYLNEDNQRLCIQCLLKMLQHLPPASSSSDLMQCKILISSLKGIQNLLLATRPFPADLISSLLAAVQVYIVFGLPGAPSVVSTSLSSIQFPDLDAKPFESGVTNSQPVGTTPDKSVGNSSKSANKKNKRKKNKAKRESAASTKDLNDDSDIDLDQTTKDSVPADVQATNGFWTTLGISDSDYSDAESSTPSKHRSSHSKVRLHALACFHTVIKSVERRVMFGYWSSFIPDSADGSAQLGTPSLFTVIMKDPSHKVRCAGLGVLSALLDGSKQFLVAAEDGDQYHNAPYTPFSVTLGGMIKEIHRCLQALLFSEPSAFVIIQIIKCLSTLVANVPYHRLKPGLLSRSVKQVRPYLSHRDSNIRVACLTCLGHVVSVQAPLMEVYQILQPVRPNNRQSEQGSRLTSSSSSHLDVTCHDKDTSFSLPPVSESGYLSPSNHDILTPCVSSGSLTPNMLERSISGDMEMSWILKLGLRIVMPLLVDKVETELSESGHLTSSPLQPLPVRLESLQLLSQVTKGYFVIVKPHLRLIQELIQACLQDPDSSVQLHGAKLLNVVSSVMLQNQQPDSTITVDLDQALSIWQAMLNGPIQTALQNRSEPIVISSVCDCLSNIGPDVFSKLPLDKMIYCKTVLLGWSADADHHVRTAAVRALGCCIVYSCLREDVSFVADTANILIKSAAESHMMVRWKAAWSLSNLSDALVMNRCDNNEDFINDFSNMLLVKLFNTTIDLCCENEKARSSAIRTIGNLLRYLPKTSCDTRRFDDAIDKSIQLMTKNVTSGSVKVRWNACYAVGNMFRNDVLAQLAAPKLKEIFTALLSAAKTCKNFKVRISAVNALAVPSSRPGYGDCEMFASVCEGLVTVLATMESCTVDFAEFKYKDSLTDQVCKTLIYILTLATVEDLERLLGMFQMNDRLIRTHIQRFCSSPDDGTKLQRSESLILVNKHLQNLVPQAANRTDKRVEALHALCQVFLPSVPSSKETTVPIASGFRQMYD